MIRAVKIAVSSMLLLALSNAALSADLAVGVEKLKTAYLFNIAKFVTWPDNPATIELCIHTDVAAKSHMQALDGRSVDAQRKISVRMTSSVQNSCHMYYGQTGLATTTGEELSFSGAGASYPADRILTISDLPSALEQGYVLQLFLDANKLRFALDQRRIEPATYRVSSKLLRLARDRP